MKKQSDTQLPSSWLCMLVTLTKLAYIILWNINYPPTPCGPGQTNTVTIALTETLYPLVLYTRYRSRGCLCNPVKSEIKMHASDSLSESRSDHLTFLLKLQHH